MKIAFRVAVSLKYDGLMVMAFERREEVSADISAYVSSLHNEFILAGTVLKANRSRLNMESGLMVLDCKLQTETTDAWKSGGIDVNAMTNSSLAKLYNLLKTAGWNVTIPDEYAAVVGLVRQPALGDPYKSAKFGDGVIEKIEGATITVKFAKIKAKKFQLANLAWAKDHWKFVK